MKEEHFNSGELSKTFAKANARFINITVGGSVQLPNCPNILLKTQFYPLINQRITPLWSSPYAKFLSLKYVFYIYIYIYIFYSIFTMVNNKIISDLSLSNISKLNLNQNTNSNHKFKINQTRKKKKKRKEKDKANLTHLSCGGEEDK